MPVRSLDLLTRLYILCHGRSMPGGSTWATTVTNNLKRPEPEALASALEALAARFGNRLITSQAVREQHAHTTTWLVPQPPDAVVMAQETADIQDVVRICAKHGVPVIAFGTGTSLEGQVNAPAGGVCIDLRDMNKVLEVHAEDLDCVIEPGITRKALNEYLRDQGVFFPIDPGADASLGGMASTRASGTNAVRYGTMRDNVLALKVVRGDGEIITTGTRAKKSSAGYDLTHLFVGAEGTLGIISELTIKLRGIPETIAAAACSFETVRGACQATILAIQTGIPVARIELLNAAQVRACNSYSKLTLPETPLLLLEFHGSENEVAEQSKNFGEIARECGGGDFTWTTRPEDRTRLWQARHDAYWAVKALRPGAGVVATDVCVPISRLADCVTETEDGPEAPQSAVADRRPCRRRQFPLLAGVRHRRCRRDGARRGVHASPGRARAGDGRHLHRRARHRPGQAEISQGRTWPRGDRCDARAEAGARSAEHFQSRKDIAVGLGPSRTNESCRRKPTAILLVITTAWANVVVRQARKQGNLGRGDPVAARRHRGGAQDTRHLPFGGRQRRKDSRRRPLRGQRTEIRPIRTCRQGCDADRHQDFRRPVARFLGTPDRQPLHARPTI